MIKEIWEEIGKIPNVNNRITAMNAITNCILNISSKIEGSRNLKQIYDIYNTVIISDIHIFCHPIFQKEIIQARRRIRSKLTDLKSREKFNKTKFLKDYKVS